MRIDLPNLAKEVCKIQTIQLYAGNNCLLITVIFDMIFVIRVVAVDDLCCFCFFNTSFREST